MGCRILYILSDWIIFATLPLPCKSPLCGSDDSAQQKAIALGLSDFVEILVPLNLLAEFREQNNFLCDA